MRLQDPQNNPTGSPAAPDYMAPLFKGWQQDAMPIRVFVRPNIQMPGFQDAFVEIVRDSLNQWCKATGNTVSYKLVNSAEAANVVFDYTEHRELVSSQHELGIDGNTEMLAKQDGTPGPTNVIILVKDHPGASKFRDRGIIAQCCLHEVGHALGMHGHSPNSHDVMFSTTLVSHTGLTERDKNTIRLMYKQRER
jgi:predicted Zn-dependent protease